MADKKKGNGGGMLPTIGIIVVTQTVLMIVFWYLLVPKLLDKEKPKPQTDLALIEELQKQEQEEKAVQDTTKKSLNLFKRDDTDYIKDRALYNNEQLNGIAVHPIDAPDVYVVVSMGYEYLQKNAKVSEELGLKLGIIMDRLNTWLSSQELDYLADVNNRSEIKDKIKELVNNVLTTGEITRVVFTQYLIQK